MKAEKGNRVKNLGSDEDTLDKKMVKGRTKLVSSGGPRLKAHGITSAQKAPHHCAKPSEA